MSAAGDWEEAAGLVVADLEVVDLGEADWEEEAVSAAGDWEVAEDLGEADWEAEAGEAEAVDSEADWAAAGRTRCR